MNRRQNGNLKLNLKMEIVSLENLSKVYHLGGENLCALNSVNLKIKSGEYMAIMGPSGSGKSTLLNVLGCLDTPSHGRYILDNNDISRLSDDRLSEIRGSKIGFVFQSYNLIAQLNVVENIEIPMYYQGYTEHESASRAKELASMVGLGDRLKHRPSELSGGQQQRVAIARALANDPVVILADEPTGNLDSKSGVEILNILDNLHNQSKTLIIVTHDENIATRAQRTIHLLDGEIERESS
ncbi:MAG: ABC transporter ATP-binding protein [Planctomycetota bacterium]